MTSVDVSTGDYSGYEMALEDLVQLQVPLGCHEEWLDMVQSVSATYVMMRWAIVPEDLTGMMNMASVMPLLTDELTGIVNGLFLCEL